MPTRVSVRRITLPAFLGFAFAGLGAWGTGRAQANRPLSTNWSPGAVPGGHGIVVLAYPTVSGEPFTAKNDSRALEMVDGARVTYESHSIVARDALGRVATRNAESPHARSGAFIPAGGTIIDPVAGVQLWWTGGGLPQLDKVAMKNRIVKNAMGPRRQPLTACEEEAGQTRHRPNGVAQQVESLGIRRIDNLLAEGCRLTSFIPADIVRNRPPITTTEETWVSPKLRVTLVYVFHGPNGVQRRWQLDNIVLGEPDPSLFVPPPGYAVQDMDAERKRQEQAEFTVQPGEPDAEMLAGAWEGDDPFAPYPAQVGIFVQILANRRVPFRHGRITGSGPQKFQEMQVRVYERIGGKDEGGWFSTTAPDGVSWDGHRLLILPAHLRPGTFASGEFALDLIFNERKGLWTGRYTREGVTRRVHLVRPGALSKAVSNPFLGVWSESGRPGHSPSAPPIPRCVYIARGSDGILVSWRDTLFGPAIDPSEGLSTATFQEKDGDAMGVKIDGGNLILQEGIYWAGLGGNAPEQFIGKLSPDRVHIVGEWEPSSPQRPEGSPALPSQEQLASWPTMTFTRITGSGCWPQGRNQ
jgi:hypothetical protein